MTFTTYAKYELLRTFRNRRFLIFAFGFPLVLYVLIAAPNRHVHDLNSSGISAPLYFMVGLLYGAGAALGVRLDAGNWLKMTWLILVGLIPFAALGIFIGHVITADSIGPALGGSTALLAFLGGVWFPLGNHGALHAIGEALPSYWLVQAAHVGLGGSGWGAKGWAVLAAWAIGATILARRAYIRDTKKA